jgi:hypothetical protein
MYTTHRLAEISSAHELRDWPAPDDATKLSDKAEGLFIWGSTVADYLLKEVLYPEKLLALLLAGQHSSKLAPECKMDLLYQVMLAECPWEDLDFVTDYQRVLGSMVVAKIPLSLAALQALLPDVRRVPAVIKFLASLVSGSVHSKDDNPAPLRILHSHSSCQCSAAKSNTQPTAE